MDNTHNVSESLAVSTNGSIFAYSLNVTNETLSSNATITTDENDMNDIIATVSPQTDMSSYSSFYSMSFAALMAVVIIAVIVVLIARKKRLDKIRHHLMPVYNYSASEDGEDWETELLDESVTTSLTHASNVNKLRPLYTNETPQLSFARV